MSSRGTRPRRTEVPTQSSLRVQDGRGGWNEQQYVLTVIDTPPNRPPVITSTPVTDAAVVTSFEIRDVPVGRDPVGVAVGDFTGNGDLSIVTANPGDQVISVAAADGNGDYAPAISTSVGEPPVLYRTFRDGITLPINFPEPIRNSAVYGLAKGDFDGDGVLDLAATAQNGTPYSGTLGWVLVWHGNGDGTFADPAYIDLVGTGYGILARDFDRDGKLDLVVDANTSTEYNLWLLRGNGDGTFEAPVAVITGVLARFQTADLNDDGVFDIVSAEARKLAVYFGDGTGGFTAAGLYDVAGDVQDLAIADVDGDGRLDIAVGAYHDQQIDVLLNDGTGQFGNRTSLKGGPNGAGFYVMGLMAADFNGNGRAELAVVSVEGRLNVIEWQTDGSLKFVTDNATYGKIFPGTFPARGSANDNTAPDVNGDGKPDIVFLTIDGDLNIAVVGINQGDGTFDFTHYVASAGSGVAGLTRTYSSPTGTVVGDFNNDGVSDLMVASERGRYAYRPGGVTIHLGTTPGRFDAPVISLVPSGGHFGVVVGDFTGDGLPDAVVPGGDSQVFPNAGDGTFGTPFLGHGWISGSGEGFTNYARVADFNADGNLDIVSLGTDGVQAGPAPRYVVAFGLGNGTFQPTVFYSPQGNGALNVAVADFNRDGLPDIAGWNISGSAWPWSGPATIEIWLNDPANPGHFHIQYNGPGNSLVTVGPQPMYPTKGFTAADFTGDGIPDLVTHTVEIDPNNPERQYVFPGAGTARSETRSSRLRATVRSLKWWPLT